MLDKKALDRAEVAAQCPKCGHQQAAVVGQLKRNPEVTCGNCGGTYLTKPYELEKEIGAVLQRAARQFGK